MLIHRLVYSVLGFSLIFLLARCGKSEDGNLAPIRQTTPIAPTNPGAPVTVSGIRIRVDQGGVVSDSAAGALKIDLVPVALQETAFATLRADLMFSDGSTQDITAEAEWVPGNATLVSLSDDGAGGKKLIGIRPGTTSIGAVYHGAGGADLSSSFEIRVLKVKGSVAQQVPSLRVGGTYQFHVVLNLENLAQVDVTSQIEFVSQSPEIAAFQPGTPGLLKGLAVGDCKVNFHGRWTGITSIGGGITAHILP